MKGIIVSCEATSERDEIAGREIGDLQWLEQGNQGIKNALRAGVASIEHGVYLDDEAIDLMREKGAYLVPTLIAPVWVAEFAEKHPGVKLVLKGAKLRKIKQIFHYR